MEVQLHTIYNITLRSYACLSSLEGIQMTKTKYDEKIDLIILY